MQEKLRTMVTMLKAAICLAELAVLTPVWLIALLLTEFAADDESHPAV